MQDKKIEAEMPSQKKQSRKKLFWAVITAVISLTVLTVYRVCLNFSIFPYVMWGYMVVLTALVVVYIVYNRGFTRRGIEVDMLPDDWSEERRIQFVEDGKRRLARSKWMLMLIIAFLVTFLFDALELFVISKFFN